MILLRLLTIGRRIMEERCTEAKVRFVRIAASGVSCAAAMLFAAMFVAVGALFLGAALTMLLASWFNSLIWAITATGLLALIVALIIWSCRRKMLYRRAVRSILSRLESHKI